ncbi:flavodoxin and radical SAM domain-containing protein [Blastomyces gilchristii SLH14081]|uniref:Flavodoxin and radical SAM domain-containing protein n=1 Tax=Blastomyces gilchristii (strain SLH14081) TaxID=559298 RepID=A0A179UB96_BLAGS|nr:flavodoxin and radical SAM domain-containing protein [Blastomyces gilchristii SLH14081]OAT05224.1 flavodoxin and radical SAM domain-containing protein [Blastomyces gilchristii SLH14081]
MAWEDLGIVARGLLTLWHRYRAPIFLLAAVIFTVVWLAPRNSQPNTPEPDSLPASLNKNQNQNAKSELESFSSNDQAAGDLPKRHRSRSSSVDNRPKQVTQPANGPKRVRGIKPEKNGAKHQIGGGGLPRGIVIQPLVFYASLTGATETYAKSFCDRLQKASHPLLENNGKTNILPPELHDLSYIELDDYFITAPKPPESAPNTRFLYCILIPTYNIDTMINTFLGHLDDTHNDFRIDTSALSGLVGYSVFGFGDREGWPTEEEGFCSQAKAVDRWMAKLTGKKRTYPLGMVDVKGDNIQKVLNEWCDGLTDVMFDVMTSGGLGEGVRGSGDPVESDEEDIDDDGEDINENGENRRNKGKNEQIMDLEDINFGGSNSRNAFANAQPLPVDFTTQSRAQASKPASQLEMVPTSSPTYAALTKQGYTIVGSHSATNVYSVGATEQTPLELPGAGKWILLISFLMELRLNTIRKLKCFVVCLVFRAERFAEAMSIRHCALSLVGEPIFYPHINKFLSLLHNDRISSFLVCNAQHPDELAALHRVTQLYVSIDASNRDSLRKIDRPLHRDFWERFQRCLDILREKRYLQRTVYRLTLVKGFNVDEEAAGYADLVEKGLPCFVEVKGVTFCGTSTSASAGLTMQNVPFYEEVVTFVVALNAELTRRGLGYGIAAEHKHSCCALLASNRFYVNDRWHTRIDYDKFFTLLEKEKNEGIPFRPEDYMRETEEWALWGNGGFDPKDTRVHTRGRNKAKLNAALKEAQDASVSAEG